MGLLGGLLLFGGIGAVGLGVLGVIMNLVMWQPAGVGLSLLILLGGLAAGAFAAVILE